MLYTPPQVRLLLLAAAAALLGLTVREWRAGFPERAAWLERLDRQEDAVDGPLRRAPIVDGPGRAPEPLPRARRHAADGDDTSPRPPPVPSTPSGPLDLNRASAADLETLPGIGPELARRIVAVRERQGGFASVAALDRVVGLGPKKRALLLEHATIDAAPPPGTPPTAGSPDDAFSCEPAC